MRRVGKGSLSVSYMWPKRKDECIVPVGHLLKAIEAPSSATGRQYSFAQKDIENVSKHFQEFSVAHLH